MALVSFPKSLDVSKAIDKATLVDCPKCKGRGIVKKRDGNILGLCKKHKEGGLWTIVDPDDPHCAECGRPVVKLRRQKQLVPCPHCKGEGKVKGAEREVIKTTEQRCGVFAHSGSGVPQNIEDYAATLTAPATEEAKRWAGYGTALKPAVEMICLARKPLCGTVADNVLRYGTGALNIDGCRIGDDEIQTNRYTPGKDLTSFHASHTGDDYVSSQHFGRWPANIILDEEAAQELDKQSGVLTSHGGGTATYGGVFGNAKEVTDHTAMERFKGDSGGAARFFYTAKASRAEREAGLEELPADIVNDGRETSIDNPYQRGDTLRRNTHPTVKPLSLLRYLCRLVTPPSGTVLDPFCGSGTTGCACALENFNFIGIELEEEYCAIAKARIKHAIKVKKTGTKFADKPKPEYKGPSLWDV
jgi:DNA-directed RNA polymerase subunit RPC12/RpoP